MTTMEIHVHSTTMYAILIGVLRCSEITTVSVKDYANSYENPTYSLPLMQRNKKSIMTNTISVESVTLQKILKWNEKAKRNQTTGFNTYGYTTWIEENWNINSWNVQSNRKFSQLKNMCKLQVFESDTHKFRKKVVKDNSIFVYLKLVSGDSKIKFEGSLKTVEETLWVWTFFGSKGGNMFLQFPVEFGIWSLGLLEVMTEKQTINLYRTSGNCTTLVVGNHKDDLVISKALLKLATNVMDINIETNQTYGPSIFCFKTKHSIENRFLSNLCKHLVCPIPAIKRQCCSNRFIISLGRRVMLCDVYYFTYEMLLWLCPMIVGLTLFFYCPLLLMYIFYLATPEKCSLQPTNVNQRCHEFVFLDNSYPVTMYNTLFGSQRNQTRNSSVCKSRLLRTSFPVLSLVIIGIQVALDHFYFRPYVLSALEKDVPMGFRAMLGGIEISSRNFLPFLGGPVIALCIYLVGSLLLLVTPRSLARVLNRGINDSSRSLDSIDVIRRFGIVKIYHWCSYGRIYHVLLGKMFILINIEYWKYVLCYQKQRWNLLYQNRLCLAMLPLYVTYCFLEIVFRILLINGIPIFSFGAIAVRAYILTLNQFLQINCNNLWSALLLTVPSICVTIVVLYLVFVFCAIFLDSSIFITRILMFAYCGIVIYPRSSYGYLILHLTVLFYTTVCFRDFANYYRRLLKDGIKISCSNQRANNILRLVIKENGVKGLDNKFFEHLIEKLRPRRVQLFCSASKLACIICFISFSISLLMKTDSIKELDTVVQLCTAVFACALPQILTVCSNANRNKKESEKQKEVIRALLQEFLASE